MAPPNPPPCNGLMTVSSCTKPDSPACRIQVILIFQHEQKTYDVYVKHQFTVNIWTNL